MKVGILSMQQVNNYGSFLQSYALKHIITGLGHDVQFINIMPGEQLAQYRISSFHKTGLLCKRLFVRNPLKMLACTLKLHQRFNNEFKPELGVVAEGECRHFDVVVIGSDEVFNVAQRTWWGFSPQLFGQGLNSDRVISYAACFGATTIEILKRLGIYDNVGRLMKNFSALSVRDANSADIVKSYGMHPQIHIDPVLAYSFEIRQLPPRQYDAHNSRHASHLSHKIDKDYMLVYTYPGRMNHPDEVSAVRKYAHSKGLRILSVSNYFSWVDDVVTPHPLEVLELIRKANCIVTDTFHGAVMSIKYNKEFSVMVRPMNRNKLMDLLHRFELQQKIVDTPEHLHYIMERPVNWEFVNKKIDLEKLRTVNYLMENINSISGNTLR